MEIQNKCIECGAYHGHSPICSLMSEEYAKSELKRYHEAWMSIEMEHRRSSALYNKNAQDKINRIRDDRDKWKGKYIDVKTENNSLRKLISK